MLIVHGKKSHNQINNYKYYITLLFSITKFKHKAEK